MGMKKINIFRWWKYYREHYEIKVVINEKMRRLRKKYKWCRCISPFHLMELKHIIDEHPEYFLDEIAEEFPI